MKSFTMWMSLAAVFVSAAISTAHPPEHVIWLEAESFKDTGSWSNDSQYVDLMGSPYLLATGVGTPVEDATTTAMIPASGVYRLWVRCKDWLPEYHPGLFQVLIDGKASGTTFGKADTDAWRWIDGGVFDLEKGRIEVRLHDLNGWWGRCDAVVLATGTFKPANNPAGLARQRLRYCGVSAEIKDMGSYDVVVVGGGPSGLGAAVAAARHGSKVALIQDRPVLGGNSSSEIQVPPMGYIGNPPDRVNVTGLAEEFFPKQGWQNFADSRKMESIVRAEKNISLFLNTRATGVVMESPDTIKSVGALSVITGQRMSFTAPLFIDCTGHGWIGYYAGAEYRMGQEARAEFGESLAPVKAGEHTMGNCLYYAVIETHHSPDVAFECPPWACRWTRPEDFEPLGSHRRQRQVVRPENFDRPSRGRGRNPGNDINGGILHAWWVEYGGMLNTIEDAEKIRDELFRINIGLWNYAKNHNPMTVEKNRNRRLVWLNYVAGVRESRRLIGDYIMTQKDFDDQIVHKDTIGFTDWGPDVHHPEGFWVRGNDCIHVYKGRRTSIPYRTLYSRNIRNLFMAGRCLSATHIAMGGTRVMRPLMQTGQAAGTAAAIAGKYRTTPRGVYLRHIQELQQELLKDGCFLPGVKNSDKNDLALAAEVTASSHVKGAEPAKVINGWNRFVDGDRNAWAPDLKTAGPHWLQMTLPKTTPVNTIHVTSEEQCADFVVEAFVEGTWKRVAAVTGRKDRRLVLHFEPVNTSRIRLTATGAVGRFVLCEVRLYHEVKRH